ncbi:hypothetical protein ACJJIF_19520 [Microbulbifer sp. SSSA002]|uniref:hypothetical protein n=1 Tax=Microbulbifer sp. SSSA002 TaxID=3243376 RepID=UPI00403920B3
MSISEELIDKLKQLRSESLSIDDFRSYVKKASDQHSRSLSPGALIKLKRGDATTVLGLGKTIVAPCAQCKSLPSERVFSGLSDHENCTRQVRDAIQKNILERVSKPSWYQPEPGQLGSEGYYKCASCGSLWCLVESERNYPGLWERIA